jgi:hypothetical protein
MYIVQCRNTYPVLWSSFSYHQGHEQQPELPPSRLKKILRLLTFGFSGMENEYITQSSNQATMKNYLSVVLIDKIPVKLFVFHKIISGKITPEKAVGLKL